jgi:hypothetical protein
MDSWLQDLTFAVRRLRNSPGFTTVAIFTLALAIGANTTVFSLLNALVLRPLPVDHPESLVFLSAGRGQNQSFPNYRDFRDRAKSVSLVATRIAVVALSHAGENARIWGYEVTGNYVQVLAFGRRPADFLRPPKTRKLGAIRTSYSVTRLGSAASAAIRELSVSASRSTGSTTACLAWRLAGSSAQRFCTRRISGFRCRWSRRSNREMTG